MPVWLHELMLLAWPLMVAAAIGAWVGGLFCYRWGWKACRIASSKPARRLRMVR